MIKNSFLALALSVFFLRTASATSLCTFETAELKALRAKGVAIEYYPVNAQSIGELKTQIRKNGPADTAGKPRDAFFSYNIEWRWPSTSTGKPSFEDLKVEYKSELVMPCWVDRKSAHPSVVQKWDAYISAMVKHEAQHAEIYFAKRDFVAQKIKVAARNNVLTSDQANAIGHSVIQEIEDANTKFDQANDNGKQEGVVLAE